MKKPTPVPLFESPPEWKRFWTGMPAFSYEDESSWHAVKVHFRNHEDLSKFAALVQQPLTSMSKTIWFPKVEIKCMTDKRWIALEKVNPKYPVYVISKGRWRKELRLTTRSLEEIQVPYRVVVEPQEYEAYAEQIDRRRILTLPFSNLGQGSIPARNWVWEHSISEGAKRHWILDDNIDGFWRQQNNTRLRVKCGNMFRAAEDFVDRFENVALAGFQYYVFALDRKAKFLPYTKNTRIYSCILIKNDIPYRWRGRYNEDTDLSLRVLKDGWCTILFNAFLCKKMPTMTMKGGNTDELYQGDGRKKMAESLQEQHPDVTKVARRWNRWQHAVNYTKFKMNKLVLKKEFRKNGNEKQSINEFGMELQRDEPVQDE